MTRSTPEWLGKTPDTPVPPRVKLRILDAHGHRCHASGRPIGPGDKVEFDHVIALCNGGENRESNIAPILADGHKAKTAGDVAIKKKIARVRKKHQGLHRPKARIPGSTGTPFKKKLDGTVVRRDTEGRG